MQRIGIISDTHSSVIKNVQDFLLPCDEIWHAGDVGGEPTLNEWARFKPMIAVYGNIDDHNLRSILPEFQYFTCQDCRVMITHIGGYPGHYAAGIEKLIRAYKPDIVVCGHSHILKVMRDQKNNLMYFNPGSAGNSGFHKSITALRLKIDGKNLKDLEVLDIAR